MGKENCSGEMLIYSRVVGYYTPVQYWNKGKKEEFRLRKTFKLGKNDDKTVEDDKKSKSAFTV